MSPFNQEKILYQKKSRYNDITVTQKGPYITLYSPDDIIQSEINLKQPQKPHLEFNRYLLFSLVFCPSPSTILVLGLGGGVVPRVLSEICPKAAVDVVEIDPEMLKVAEDYFGFTTSDHLHVHLEDACDFIGRTRQKYDLVVIDTYCGLDLPQSVDNPFFFKDCGKILSEKGILTVNLVPFDKHYMEKRVDWIKQVLAHVYLICGITRLNEVVFAVRRPVEKADLLKNAAAMKKRLPGNLKVRQLFKRLECRSGEER